MHHVRLIARIALLSFAILAVPAVGRAAPAPLTTAAEVLSLPARYAGERRPVHVTGVVTAAEPDWNGQFFVQDATGGVFVENFQVPHPMTGDVVEIDGVTAPGAFAPIITAPKWKILGEAPLPPARRVPIEDLEAGIEDGQRIEVTGVVRSAHLEPPRLVLDLAVGGYRLQAYTRIPPVGNIQALIGARVRVRGTAATHYNAALRHLTSVAVYAPTLSDFVVEQTESVDPFTLPPIPLNNVAQYRRDSSPGKRIHVEGVVTLQHLGEDLYLHDDTGGLRIRTTQLTRVAPGDTVDAVGFLEFDDYLPVLRDAVFVKRDVAPRVVQPRHVTPDEILNSLHHADLVTLRGKIVDRSTRPYVRDVGGYTGIRTSWVIQGEGLGFTIEYEAARENAALEAIPVGSTVQASGVCLSDIGADGKLRSVRLLLPAPADLKVLARPSWLTPQRLLIGLGIACAALAAVLAWSLTVSKKNAALSFLIREREKAQRELQEAHDTLEQKVKERTAQLKVEMTARKSSELQFKAVLAERTRLARDLHDSLEQTLTGISLQLDTAAKLFQRSPDDSSRHLELARNWMHQSQVELRRSIWDLRSRELEQFDLANALRRSAEQMLSGAGIELTMETRGEDKDLPEIVEENALRIAQEALTNVIKHARATRVSVALDTGEAALTLRIQDNGTGFVPVRLPSPGDNHFGLLGMSERAKRLAGRVSIDSAPGRGTLVTVEIPLEAPPSPAPASGDELTDI